MHSENLTHREFSRNASSSRAIPVKKILAQVWNDPALPIHWGSNQPGMQAGEELTGWRLATAKLLWGLAGKTMCAFAWGLMKLGLHKQVVNRILEPWQYISVVLTSTQWDNFFSLRDHPDAQPEIQELARAMKKAMEESIPVEGIWHLPYIGGIEFGEALDSRNCMGRSLDDVFHYLAKLSSARCARVSYLTHDGKRPDVAKDLELFIRLVGSDPIHASPTEHQAQAADDVNVQSGNFRGWHQFRKTHVETRQT